MQADFRPARRAWLVVIALGHVAVLMAWRPIARQAIEATPSIEGELIFLALPAGRSDDVAAPPPARQVQPARQARAGRPATAPVAIDAARPEAAPTASEESPPTATLPADPFARPAAPAETLRDKARKSVAGIDRQLRKESLNKFATIVNEDTALGRAISGGPAPKLSAPESYMGANGVIHKRYMLRGKMVCEEVDHIGVGGHDPFRSGSRARYVRCPK